MRLPLAAPLSQREFARREGCSHTLVQKAVRAGDLATMDGGRLDPALVGTAWRRMETASPLPMPGLLPEPRPGETLADAAQRLVDRGGDIPARAESERVKEHFLAKLRQLEFQTKSRAVLPRGDVEQAMAEAMTTFRTALESIAGRLSAELAGLSDPAVIKDRIADEHRRALHTCADRFERLAADLQPDGAGNPPAPEADGGPVGERRPGAAEGKRRTRAVPK